MRQHSLIGIFCLLLMAGACQEPVTKKPAPDKALYFDVPGFIQSQAAMLEAENPQALKMVMEKGQVQERKLLQDLEWPKELAVFSELDLNKPALRNSFLVKQLPDSAGLSTIIYQKKPGADGDIVFVAVTRNSRQQVQAIRAQRKNANSLITSTQHLALSCVEEDGRLRIQTIKIGGKQKTLFFDPLHYLIITEIN